MDRNIARAMRRLGGLGVNVRPHLKTAKSPDVARRLAAAGARGFCVAKVSEAEVFAAAGMDDLLITTEVAGEAKLRRLAALLARHPRITAVVDAADGASALNAALSSVPRRARVLLDIDVGQGRTGIAPGSRVLELARHVAAQPRLELAGVMGYEGHLQMLRGAEERDRRCREAISRLTGAAGELRAAGFSIEVVTTGGTGTAEICAGCAGVTEVQPGSFIFMDTAYREAIGSGYEQALTLVSTVVSCPRPGEAVVDAGLKSLSTDSGPAEPVDLPDLRYRPAGDEHGIVSWDPRRGRRFELGERIALAPSHIDTTVSLHDAYQVFDGGRFVATWPIAARGKVQ